MISGSLPTIKSYKYTAFFTLVFLFIGCTKKLVPIDKITPNSTLLSTSENTWTFPDDWMGYWEGDLSIYTKNGLSQTIPMALDNRPTDTLGLYHWAIIYGEDTIKGRRDYYLEEKDPSIGHYITDERNSILINSYHRGNTLASAFEVMGNFLTSTYTRTKEGITFEILMMKHKQGVLTGGMEGDTSATAIPVVTTYPVAVRQVAYLKKR